MRKQILLIIFLALLVLAVVYGGLFFSKHIKRVLPLLKKAEEPITELIDKQKSPLLLPEGFSISIFASGLEKPRVLTRDPLGNVVVSIPSRGEIIALPDRNGDGVADERITILEGLNKPHGIVFRCFLDDLGVEEMCQLFVAEEDKLTRYEYDKATFGATNAFTMLELPSGGNHTTRTLLLHPDGKRLLVSVGSSCNVCNESDERRAVILATPFIGGEYTLFAKGLRNAVFMTVHPSTQDVWVTEMGRDLLGDDLPPDEINIVREGRNYGWPLCYGENVLDTDFHKDDHMHIRPECTEPFEEPSYIDIEAHSAALGLAFVPEGAWPVSLWNDLIVAYHGSWNRSEPTGYKLVRMVFDDEGTYVRTEDFITGWFTEKNEVLGRPVDVLILPSGTMFISDDRTGVIYRVTYEE